ncbi:MAG: nucleotide exchange factor GrpE [Candidatus Riflebacteria bacterium]|nr:nucleotide exchange factor GrpE [Candidatus Riflebacteria bacterium]
MAETEKELEVENKNKELDGVESKTPEPLANETAAGVDSEKTADQETKPENKPEDLVKKLSAELEEAKKELHEKNNRCLRALADYDNLTKRTEIQVRSAASNGAEYVVKKILPVLDSFESAISKMAQASVEKKILDGFEMLYIQFSDILEKEGLKPIVAKGSKFDPNLHEALGKQTNPDVEDDVVLQEYEKGYLFREKVLRTAKVCINQK